MKIWIDDIRPIPEGDDVWIKRVDEAIDFISIHKDEISLLDLDHDAGDYFCYGGDYIKILDWMEKKVSLFLFLFIAGTPMVFKKCGK